jgi:Family of unknown function (DUF5681)
MSRSQFNAEVNPASENSGRTGRRMPVGRRFKKGISGNPGGRPRDSKTYAIRQLVAEAINDPLVRKAAVDQVKGTLQHRRTVLPALEFEARLNKEIGLGSGEAPTGVTIIFESKHPAAGAKTGPRIGPMSDSRCRVRAGTGPALTSTKTSVSER